MLSWLNPWAQLRDQRLEVRRLEDELGRMRERVREARHILLAGNPQPDSSTLVDLARGAAGMIALLRAESPERSRIVCQRRELAMLNAMVAAEWRYRATLQKKIRDLENALKTKESACDS